jgi:hypothetical protein
MYLTTVGGSMLLHILAGHPKLVAALGIVGAVAMLSSPLGPGAHLGTEGYAARLERAFAPNPTMSTAQKSDVEKAVDRLIATQDPRVAPMLASALSKCGTNCSDLGIQQVMQNSALEREVLVLYAWDQISKDPQPASPAPKVAAGDSPVGRQ